MTETRATLVLKEVPASAEGAALGLRPGDLLAAINGRAFAGDEAALWRRFAEAGGAALALTFQRGAAEVTVLSSLAALGRWEAAPAPVETEGRPRIEPALWRNWEVMRAADGSYDLFPRTLPTWALALPQLWLMQMRLWLPCAMLAAAVAAGFIVHPLLALAVHLAGGAHLRWAHAIYLRSDRRGRGLGFAGVVAARGEGAAHAAWRALSPDDRYLFAAKPRSPDRVPA